MFQVDSTSPPARLRAGGTVLSLLASPLSAPILRAHLDGPLRLPDLRERITVATQTTLRGQVGNLRGIGALARRVRNGLPYTVENELTDVGRGILAVADALETWLARAPQGPIGLGSESAKAAIKALVGGWSSTILRALAARPLSLTELDGVIREVSYPSLERRLSAMRATRLVKPLPGQGRGRPYTVTEWTRRSVGPIAKASRCERMHLPEVTDPPTRVDLEAAFLLAVPLVALPGDQAGSCVLAVDAGVGGQASRRHIAGVDLEVQAGEVVSCVSRLARDPQTWAMGTAESWLEAIGSRQIDRLRIGGADPGLVKAVIAGLHASLATT
jgi:DNA-binding HxlR family transcriptional regulator